MDVGREEGASGQLHCAQVGGGHATAQWQCAESAKSQSQSHGTGDGWPEASECMRKRANAGACVAGMAGIKGRQPTANSQHSVCQCVSQ